MDAREAREYISRHKQEQFTLLDVRQPGEYEQEHLPGSKLVPLPDLDRAVSELDPEKPTIVY